MTAETTATIREFVDRLYKSERIAYLIARWQDEREYEDINSYRPSLEAEAPDGVKITRMYRRPFGCRFEIGAERFILKLFASGRIQVLTQP